MQKQVFSGVVEDEVSEIQYASTTHFPVFYHPSKDMAVGKILSMFYIQEVHVNNKKKAREKLYRLPVKSEQAKYRRLGVTPTQDVIQQDHGATAHIASTKNYSR